MTISQNVYIKIFGIFLKFCKFKTKMKFSNVQKGFAVIIDKACDPKISFDPISAQN